MLTRRIVASACALCLAVPAAATAKDVRYVGHVHHAAAIVATGDTKGDLPGAVPAVGAGDTKDDLSCDARDAQHGRRAAAPRRSSTASTDDATNSWRLAAVVEGCAARRLRYRRRRLHDGPPAPRSPHGGVGERAARGRGRTRPRPHSVCVRNGRRPRAR